MALVISILSWRIQDFRYSWFLTAITGLVIWTIIVISYTVIPIDSYRISWEITQPLNSALHLKLDEISWSYSFALTTFFLTYVLTSFSIRNKANEDTPLDHHESSYWILSLINLGISLIACLSGNLITIIAAWLALDFLDIIIKVNNSENVDLPGKNSIWFSAKIISILCLIWVIALSLSLTHSIDLRDMTPQISFFVIIATGIRLVIMPNDHQNDTENQHLARFYILLKISPIISYLMLLTHTNIAGMSSNLVIIFISIASVIALYSSFRWAISKTEIINPGFWIVALSIFTLVSALLNKTSASISWGISLILAGSVIFLRRGRDKRSVILHMVGLFCASAIPFSASWYGVEMYDDSLPGYLIILFILSQALLLFGYVRHSLSLNVKLQKIDRFFWVIYLWGLAMALIAQYLVTVMIMYLSDTLGNSPPSIEKSLPSMFATIISIFLVYVWRKNFFTIKFSSIQFKTFSGLKMLPGYTGRFFSSLSKVVTEFNLLIEGRGAFFWALLFLTLLISILSRLNLGGE